MNIIFIFIMIFKFIHSHFVSIFFNLILIVIYLPHIIFYNLLIFIFIFYNLIFLIMIFYYLLIFLFIFRHSLFIILIIRYYLYIIINLFHSSVIQIINLLLINYVFQQGY